MASNGARGTKHEECLLSIPGHLECAHMKRLNRFVAEVALEDRTEPAHINNTCRLLEFLVERTSARFCLGASVKDTLIRP